MLKLINLMQKKLLTSPSPQAVKIYSLLEKSGPMSARDIGTKLKIFPNAIYREIRKLLALGFVTEVFSYPLKFQAKPPTEAVAFYSSIIRQNFFQMLGHANSKDSELNIAFFQTRKDLLKLFGKDSAKAKKQ